eukprot:3451775-Prymnesium_polylepis.1
MPRTGWRPSPPSTHRKPDVDRSASVACAVAPGWLVGRAGRCRASGMGGCPCATRARCRSSCVRASPESGLTRPCVSD